MITVPMITGERLLLIMLYGEKDKVQLLLLLSLLLFVNDDKLLTTAGTSTIPTRTNNIENVSNNSNNDDGDDDGNNNYIQTQRISSVTSVVTTMSEKAGNAFKKRILFLIQMSLCLLLQVFQVDK